jgi:hypothetical protein
MREDIQKPRRTLPDYDLLARKNAKIVLLAAGYDQTTIEEEITKFLSKPLLFDIPSWDELKALHASK